MMKPTLVSDPDNSRKTRDADVTFTDDGEDTEEEPEPYEALISRRRPNMVYNIVGYHKQ